MSDDIVTRPDSELIALIRGEMHDVVGGEHLYSSSCRVCTDKRHAVMDDVLDRLGSAADEIERLRTQRGVEGLNIHGICDQRLAVERENADRLAAALRKWSRIDPNDLEAIRAHDALRGPK